MRPVITIPHREISAAHIRHLEAKHSLRSFGKSEVKFNPTGGEVHRKAVVLQDISSDQNVMRWLETPETGDVLVDLDIWEQEPDTVSISVYGPESGLTDLSLADGFEAQAPGEAGTDRGPMSAGVNLRCDIHEAPAHEGERSDLNIQSRPVQQKIGDAVFESVPVPLHTLGHFKHPLD